MSASAALLARRMHRLTWCAFAVLLAVQVSDIVVLRPPWIAVVVKLLPLLVFVPGMLRDNLRSYIWLCFVSLLYFISLVERLFIDATEPRAIAGMAAVVVLFVAAMLYVRWRARALRPAQAGAAPTEEERSE